MKNRPVRYFPPVFVVRHEGDGEYRVISARWNDAAVLSSDVSNMMPGFQVSAATLDIIATRYKARVSEMPERFRKS